ncbi:MAG TPA: hypothetical protein VHF58_10240 [Solirubrobacterales bacterium]|nr:hypothetical protein [Solirubrobacterales bacterium]
MKKAGLCAAAILVSLAVAVPAQADKLKLRGSLIGVPTATVKMGVEKRHGDIKRVTSITFKRVPVNCADGTGGEIQGQLTGFGVRGKDFTRKGPIRGTGINNGFLRVAGKFSRGGKVAKGNVRFSFQNNAGAGCGTDDVNWKARR